MVEKYCQKCNCRNTIGKYYKNTDGTINEHICRLQGRKTYYELLNVVQERYQKVLASFDDESSFCICRFTDMDKFYEDVRKLRVEQVDKSCPYYTEIFLEILKKS